MGEGSEPFKVKVRRVLTSVNAEGKSCVMADGEPGDVLILNGCRMVRLWQTETVPADIPAKGDVTEAGLPRLSPGFAGTRFYTAELPAGVKIAMHKSLSVDYIAVMQGTLTLELETGAVDLTPGDVVVQTGNMHAWENRTSAPCLIMVCVVGAVER